MSSSATPNRARRQAASSWRWNDLEEFCEFVRPVHINEVDYVRLSWRTFSWANSIGKYYRARKAFERAVAEAQELLESSNGAHNLATSRCILDIGHHGEMILLYRKRLAKAPESSDFIYEKQFIQHAAHKLHRPSHPIEIEQVVEAASRFLNVLFADDTYSDDFIVDRVRNLPEPLGDDFFEARDLFSIGQDNAGLFSTCRGLEGVCREILKLRRISFLRKDESTPAHEANLFDVIEILGRLRWKVNSSLLVSPTARGLLQWMREIRNDGAHVGSLPAMETFELAPLVADSAAQLWRTNAESTKRQLKETNFRKTW